MNQPTCGYCPRTLTECPHGQACQGSWPGHPHPDPDCRYGMVCPTHGPHWPRGHYPAEGRLRHATTNTNQAGPPD